MNLDEEKVNLFRQEAKQYGFSDQEIDDFLAQIQALMGRMGGAGENQNIFSPRINEEISTVSPTVSSPYPIRSPSQPVVQPTRGASLNPNYFLTPEEQEIYFKNLKEIETEGPEALKIYQQSKSGSPRLMRGISRLGY